MQREILIIDPKYQESTAMMFGIGKTKHIVNKISISLMMNKFEVPVCPFGSSIKKGCNCFL